MEHTDPGSRAATDIIVLQLRADNARRAARVAAIGEAFLDPVRRSAAIARAADWLVCECDPAVSERAFFRQSGGFPDEHFLGLWDAICAGGQRLLSSPDAVGLLQRMLERMAWGASP